MRKAEIAPRPSASRSSPSAPTPNPTHITMLFFAFRRRDAFFIRTPMKITAFSAYWHKASLSRTRKTAKRTALRTSADAVVGGAIRASDALYCECHSRVNRHQFQPAHEDQALTHFSISKQSYSGLTNASLCHCRQRGKPGSAINVAPEYEGNKSSSVNVR